MRVDRTLQIKRRQSRGVCFYSVEVVGNPPLVACHIEGIENNRGGNEVVNSIVEGKKAELQRQWKLKIAGTVRNARKLETPPIPCVVSIAFLMCPANHGGRSYDVENFVKPVVDGVAMGLWGNLDAVNADPKIRFDADDSVFQSLYFEHLQVQGPGTEGVYVLVSPF